MRVVATSIAALLVPAAALASPMTVEGDVVAAHSRWTSDGSRIITEATVRTPDGSTVVVRQLGGTVDGLAMLTFPGPELLEPGMRVAVAATPRPDLSQRMHNIIDSVRVLSTPPGFVRTGPAAGGHYLYWESGCVYVMADSAGTKEIAGDQEFPVISASIQTWNDATSSCSFMNLVEEKPEAREVGRDHINLIKFRDVSWCRPATGDDGPHCHAMNAAGLTTAVFVNDPKSDRDGAIVDADIELNGVDFAIGVDGVTLGTAPCLAELQNTLTHELGHLLGLEHPCRVGADPERVDHNGAAVPTCNAASGNPLITEATMYNFQDCNETKKATLSDDDAASLCAIYPKADDPGSCGHVGDEGGCCSASQDSGFPLQAVLGGLGLGVLLLRRRRTVGPPAPPARRA